MPASRALDSLSPLPQNRSASERVAERLRELIGSGNVAPGEKLPSENELARALQVSRPVVREALRGLAMMGVVESRQGEGCYVTDLDASRLMAPLSFFLELREYRLDDLFRARSLIDGGLAQDAALSASPSQRARLSKLAALGATLTGDPVAFRVTDAEFHDLISEAAGNEFLHRVSQALYGLAIEMRRMASTMPGVLEQSAADHAIIAQAIASGDARAAREAMVAHVEHIRATTEQARCAPKDPPGG